MQTEVAMSKLISLKQAARVFAVSESHMRRMVACERFPFYRLGHRLIRVDPEEIRQANIGVKILEKSLGVHEAKNGR